MLHDEFESERFRVERVLEIVEHAGERIDARAYVPVSLLKDAVEFIRVAEDAAYEASQTSAGAPPLSACIEQHIAAREPLRGMQAAVRAMGRREAVAGVWFARMAREYVRLRRDHMRADDRLFAATARPHEHEPAPTWFESVESARIRQIYDRLVEESTMLEIATPASGSVSRGRSNR
jgi:hemerythrin-like domain-containing protein